jgi:hypothetical protein
MKLIHPNVPNASKTVSDDQVDLIQKHLDNGWTEAPKPKPAPKPKRKSS